MISNIRTIYQNQKQYSSTRPLIRRARKTSSTLHKALRARYRRCLSPSHTHSPTQQTNPTQPVQTSPPIIGTQMVGPSIHSVIIRNHAHNPIQSSSYSVIHSVSMRTYVLHTSPSLSHTYLENVLGDDEPTLTQPKSLTVAAPDVRLSLI